MPNVKLKKLKNYSPFRKVAMGTWRTAKDPSVYGLVEIDMKNVLAWLPDYSLLKGVKVNVSHAVGKALSLAMVKRPEINGMIRANQIYLREEVSLFYQVNIPGDDKDKVKKATLSGLVIHGVENLKTCEISKKIADQAYKIKNNQDKELAKNLNFFKKIPWCLTGLYLDFVSWLIYGLNWDLSFLGVPKDPFGSAMITNVGGLGIDKAWAPLCPYTRVPLLLTIGKIRDEVVVIDSKMEIRPMMPIGITFDHRFIDGVHAAQMAEVFKKCFENPEKYLA